MLQRHAAAARRLEELVTVCRYTKMNIDKVPQSDPAAAEEWEATQLFWIGLYGSFLAYSGRPTVNLVDWTD